MTEDRSADDLTRDPQAEERPDTLIDKARKTNDPKALKKQALSDKQKALAEEADLLWVLSTPAGVRFLARLLCICGVDEVYFHPSNSIMCETAGRRSIARQVKGWIRDCRFDLWVAVDREIEELRPKAKKD